MKQYKLLSLLVVISLLIAACGGGGAAPAPAAEAPAAEAPAAAPTDTPAAAAEAAAPAEAAPAADAGAKEAPMWATKVAAGEIPPLEERLPKDPFVVGPGVLLAETSLANWEPGQYKDGSCLLYTSY